MDHRPGGDGGNAEKGEERQVSQCLTCKDAGQAPGMVNGASEVFELTTAEALDMLCENIDRLVRSACDSAVTTPQRRKSSESIGEGGERANVSEFHFAHSVHGDEHCGGRDRAQQGILARRFLSKREPPIPLKEYLQRLHRYCPMSTAVYLATNIYITRIVAVERILQVNARNMHRLVLAGLRVAMKALEDLSYPHSRFAKVGGVSERELSRLEISFCFLADFELRVDARTLDTEVRSLRADISNTP
ncbi:hypothetical protein ASPZODRAFT_173490 [Penicilliopsis zonata CBS 506.65]|uniref:Cyclin n=1 Tax=Penicilliopsis zonata CBS 506.65 TaxID=1073090 RepID=A0A1L9STM1_9EURO|nr:hypothetical protein ASPZODRAFT_173490 [Penicilliopsis zonata CBS 506.65]OJJ50461.1 hypothetical protein ASPZODRAFT_173490 [Penicilliopsis zonata CBS 506.65]